MAPTKWLLLAMLIVPTMASTSALAQSEGKRHRVYR